MSFNIRFCANSTSFSSINFWITLTCITFDIYYTNLIFGKRLIDPACTLVDFTGRECQVELDKFRGGAQHHPCHLPRQQGRRKGTVYRGDVIYKWWGGVGVGGKEGGTVV